MADNVLVDPYRAISVGSERVMFVALLRFARRLEEASEHVTHRKVLMEVAPAVEKAVVHSLDQVHKDCILVQSLHLLAPGW